MNLSEPFIRRPVMTTLLMLCLCFFGIFSYFSLPVSSLPNVDFPTLQVSVSYPGANPETLSHTVATPLEKEFMTIDGLHTIVSSSRKSSMTLILQFDLQKSMDTASLDVEAAISRAIPNLPPDLPYNPVYRKVNPSQAPIYYLAITSPTMTLAELYNYGDTFLGRRINRIEGVSQVITYGAPFAVRVQVDPQKLAARQMGINEVAAAIQEGNVNLPTGVLYGPTTEYSLEVQGQLPKAEVYNSLVLKAKQGALVTLSEVGRALDSLQDDKFSLSWHQKGKSKSCIVLAVQTQPGSNTIEVTERIDQILPRLKQSLPPSLQVSTIFKRADPIQDSVNEVKLTVGIAFIFVVLIIYFCFGKVLNTLIPSLAIPMSILGILPFLYLWGFSLDILSLLAITLSIGFLVDDAIVVLENVVRHVQRKKSPYQAALEGSQEISVTVFSMTLCLAVVFLPMLFLQGILGRLFHEFSLTIIFAVLMSGIISLTLTPLLCSRLIPKAKEKKPLNRVEKASQKAFERMLFFYEKGLAWSLKRRLFLLSLGVFSCLGTAALFHLLPKDFLPLEDQGFLQGFSQAKEGTSPALMKRYQDEVARLITKDPAVESCISISSVSSIASSNQGFFFIRLKPYQKRPSIFAVIQKLMQKASHIPGINTYLAPLPTINLQVGTTLKGLYQYTLTSLDEASLYKSLPILMSALEKIPGLTQLSSDLQVVQPQLNISIDRKRASDLGITAKDIELLLKLAYSDNRISTIQTPIDQYDVILETLPSFYQDPKALSALYLKNIQGKMVPLKQLIEVKLTTGPITINHVNGLPSTTVSFNLQEGTSLGEVLSAIEATAKKVLPPQVQGRTQGSTEVFKNSFQSFPFLFLMTLFVLYVILGILYESFIHPITVLSALFPATLGGMFTLYLAKEPLSLYSFVGIILLMGIVMKNGILMVDFANQSRKGGKSAYDSILQASLIRFRPIFMTSISALMGALPIALGIGGPNAFTRRPLGMAIVGGLIFSQVLTLFLTPVIYYYLEMLQEKLQKKT